MARRGMLGLALWLGLASGAAAQNAIQAENALTGNPPSEWQVVGAGDPSIQGFATDISVDQGETVRFKVDTPSSDYKLAIYRLGYYGGDGARLVATVEPSASLPQNQPPCLTDGTTGLVDCGNWAESAHWDVPVTAVSGVYVARLVREDAGHIGKASHMVFIVRDDDGNSNILLQTSDTTWQAYNSYGGASLYGGGPGPQGGAYKVSYNRPFNTRAGTPEDWVFNAEFPLIRWLERNGYDVSYTTGIDTDRRGSELLEHQVFMTVGHDEYWSGQQRANVEAARGAGKHLVFLAGNDLFWKTRWENSTDGNNTAYRTLVTYKETHAGAKIDPNPAWTGTWRDARFSPPADGGRPENGLTGTIFTVNCCTATMQVPGSYGALRFWRNTAISTLPANQTATLASDSLGYEWNEDLDNGARPQGLLHLSSTSVSVPQRILDNGSNYGPGNATHHLTLYRHSSGALVFSAGSVQWSWGLDSTHDRGNDPADVRMQQATVNLLADMGVSAGGLQNGLTQTSASTDVDAPTTVITLPAANATIPGGFLATGTAADVGGVVAAVEASLDDGLTWHQAAGTASWSYALPSTPGPMTLLVRAIDDSGNIGAAASRSATVDLDACPCSFWDNATVPPVVDAGDAQAVELGMKFQSSTAGYVTGVRFYKATTNVGVHTGRLWSAGGALLGSVTFINESASGWQAALFDSPIAIAANTTYVVSYHAPTGHYSDQHPGFTAPLTRGRLTALANGGPGGPNGVYRYGAGGVFPTDTFDASNYFVDVILETQLSSYTGFGNETPGIVDANDGDSYELGVKFRVLQPGKITAVRFYKSVANTGPHTGTVWNNATGLALATATFTSESASGWQEVAFATPVDVVPGTTYIASYFAPSGHYSFAANYFAASQVSRDPIVFLRSGDDGPNGVFKNPSAGFPSASFNDSFYWVDVRFVPDAGPDGTPPTITSANPVPGAAGVSLGTFVQATFSEPMAAASITGTTFELRDNTNNLIAATVNYVGNTATLTPTSPLSYSTTYAAKVKGGAGGVTDLAGNPLATDFTWTFTTLAAPPPPPDQGPGGPILVVGGQANKFGRYVAEILRNEGLNAFDVINIDALDQTQLNTHTVVILGESDVDSAQVTLLSDWVSGGGSLIALRPDSDLSTLLGLTAPSGTLSNAYLKIDGTQPPGQGLETASMQFHGTADLYQLGGATAVAMLWSNATTATTNPAVTMRSVGAGHAVAFMFDLARSIVYTRQGNPAWAGDERDGIGPMRSDDLFFGGAEADWIDLTKVAIPQADEQQRLLANIIQKTSPYPLPRFWYLPKDLKAAVVMTGDEHGGGGNTIARFEQQLAESPSNCSVNDWECVRSSSYIYANGIGMTPAQALSYHNQGFELGVHINTGCANWTPLSLEGDFAGQLANFAALYPALPAPISNRTHCIVWSDWVTHAKVERDHGIRLDTNYYYWPPGWVQNRPGFFTGSGMPMRFADTDGTMIDTYQATSQMTDESNQVFPFTINTLLDNAVGPLGYYGVFTANMHTDYGAGGNGTAQSSTIVASAQARGVPVVSGRQMAEWLDGRNASSFQAVSFAVDTLSFHIAPNAGARNLRAMLPSISNGKQLVSLTRNGSAVTYVVETIKGIAYARFDATAGDYVANYQVDNAAPTITNVLATPLSGSVTITWDTNEPARSVVHYGLTPGNLNLTASSAGLSTTHSVQQNGLNVGTTYYYRVESADAAANSATEPAIGLDPLVFATPAGQCFVDTSVADFSQGVGDAGVGIANVAGGELILKPTMQHEFEGAALPGDLTSVSWGGTSSTSVSSGQVTVNGERVQAAPDAFLAPGQVLEFVATFRADSFQHVGFGNTFNELPFVIFTTANGTTQLFARSFTAAGADNLTALGDLLNVPHRYRIEWGATEQKFYVDGALVATHTAAVGENLRPLISDFNANGTALSVDWWRLLPYAGTGVFNSRVIDAGNVANWQTVEFDRALPANTGAAVQFSAGNTPTPDVSWSTVSIPSSGGLANIVGRYAQYTVSLATSDPNATSEIARVAATCVVNHTPVANPQSVPTDEDTPINITLTGSDGDNDPLTYAVGSGPAHGSLGGTAPSLTYTPDLNYFGADAFTFTVDDGHGPSTPATVSIAIASVNDVPTANSQSVDTDEDTALGVTLTGNDVESPLTFSITVQPTHGTVSAGTGANRTYTPAANYHGSDSFTFVANDGLVNSAPATVTIAVNSIADVPVANSNSYSTPQNIVLTVAAPGVLGNDTDGDGDSLTASLETDVAHGVLALLTDGSFSYAPTTGYCGADAFSYRAHDATSASLPATVNITVACPAQAPTMGVSPSTQSLNYSDLVTPLTFTVTDVDSVSTTLTTKWRIGTGTLKNGLPSGLTLTGNGCNPSGQGSVCSWTVSGAFGEKPGTYSIVATASDGTLTAISTGTLTVTKETLTVLGYGPAANTTNPILHQAVAGVATLTLSARVAEKLPDINGAAGNLALATGISMKLAPVSGTAITSTACTSPVSGSGYNQVRTVTCTFNNVPVRTYTVTVAAGGLYFTLPTSGLLEDVVVVYDPTQPKSAVGAEFIWPGTAHDLYAGDVTRVGYELSAPSASPTGTLLLIRRTEDGRFYRLRGSVISSLAITPTANGAEETFIVTNANYLRPNPNGTSTTLSNRKLYMYGDDGGGIAPDRVWLKLRSSTAASGTTYGEISLPDPASANALSISSGDVIIVP